MGEQEAQVGSNDWVDEQLKEIDNIQNPSEKVKALVNLASEMLPSQSTVLEEARVFAASIHDGYPRAKALSAIAPFFSKVQQQQLSDKALQAVASIQDDDSLKYDIFQKYERFQAEALNAIALLLPGSPTELIQKAYNIAISIQDDAYSTIKA